MTIFEEREYNRILASIPKRTSIGGVGSTVVDGVDWLNLLLTFNTCGASGRSGPTPAAVVASYVGTPLEGYVTGSSGENAGVQFFTPRVSGVYEIFTAGASGGQGGNISNVPGNGCACYGSAVLTAGEMAVIFVGQMGEGSIGTEVYSGGGGGGGSMLAAFPVIFSSGGGGGSCDTNNALTNGNATSIPSDGNPGVLGNFGAGGAGGAGGGAGDVTGGGAGRYSNGADSISGTGGKCLYDYSGMEGGASGGSGGGGGYGGGGGGGDGGGGGGGGYNGGGGGGGVVPEGGGGGGGGVGAGATIDSFTGPEAAPGDGIVRIRLIEARFFLGASSMRMPPRKNVRM